MKNNKPYSMWPLRGMVTNSTQLTIIFYFRVIKSCTEFRICRTM